MMERIADALMGNKDKINDLRPAAMPSVTPYITPYIPPNTLASFATTDNAAMTRLARDQYGLKDSSSEYVHHLCHVSKHEQVDSVHDLALVLVLKLSQPLILARGLNPNVDR